MKKLAIDLDGVVFDSENLTRVYTEIYDVEVFKKDSIIDNSKRELADRYSWPEQISDEFWEGNSEFLITNANFMPGAVEIINKLLKKFEIIIVTARSDIEVGYSIERLKNIGLGNVKIFSDDHEKVERLIQEKVDYYIEDDLDMCKNASLKSIKALYFKNAAAPFIPENEYFKIVNNWGEIYKYLILHENL